MEKVLRTVGETAERVSRRRLVEPLPKVRSCEVLRCSLGRRDSALRARMFGGGGGSRASEAVMLGSSCAGDGIGERASMMRRERERERSKASSGGGRAHKKRTAAG